MAPTKAIARYAVTTLSLLTKGPMKVIGKSPWFTSLARSNAESSKAFQAEKVSLAALFLTVETLEPHPTWLKTRKNNALKSP
jgi:hypothetical protein